MLHRFTLLKSACVLICDSLCIFLRSCGSDQHDSFQEQQSGTNKQVKGKEAHVMCTQLLLKHPPRHFTWELQNCVQDTSVTHAVIHVKLKLVKLLPLLNSMHNSTIEHGTEQNGAWGVYFTIRSCLRNAQLVSRSSFPIPCSGL